MLTATEAHKTADKVNYDTIDTLVSILNKHIAQASRQGKYGLGYLAPISTSENTLRKVREILLSFGYRLTDWEEKAAGYDIKIYW